MSNNSDILVKDKMNVHIPNISKLNNQLKYNKDVDITKKTISKTSPKNVYFQNKQSVFEPVVKKQSTFRPISTEESQKKFRDVVVDQDKTIKQRSRFRSVTISDDRIHAINDIRKLLAINEENNQQIKNLLFKLY